MSLEMRPQALTRTALDEYAAVSIAFAVDRILEVTLADGGLGGMLLTEIAVAEPYVKDYDAVEAAGPSTCWPEHFDISGWGLICGRRDGVLVVRYPPGRSPSVWSSAYSASPGGGAKTL